MAQFAEGRFRERGRGLELEAGPPLTKAILERLQTIAERAAAKEISVQQAIREIKEVNPELGKTLYSFGNLLTALTILLMVVQMYMQYQDSKTTAEFNSDVKKYLERQTVATEQLARQDQIRSDAQRKRTAKPKDEAKPEKAVVLKKSDRRADVGKARRRSLLEYRKSFKPRPK
ncbi:hypothetical protein P6U16_05435 [Rhizobium sp. 32-5/1]|uniref:hypothetical protein n=1 Tax=Rhizobium sp. 32-5/1 TaxID=3019602 RepID=UPI00240E247A|nr:hypothetical protein [Rhizobium sp. 32-5/1]WEZ84131.1 hypothetical protein P6U16_05435 [Rhizobium sp. 32-5/1]